MVCWILLRVNNFRWERKTCAIFFLKKKYYSPGGDNRWIQRYILQFVLGRCNFFFFFVYRRGKSLWIPCAIALNISRWHRCVWPPLPPPHTPPKWNIYTMCMVYACVHRHCFFHMHHFFHICAYTHITFFICTHTGSACRDIICFIYIYVYTHIKTMSVYALFFLCIHTCMVFFNVYILQIYAIECLGFICRV